jgi:hypothetical protein
MHLYRQLWKKLAQTANKLEQQCIKFIYNVVIQALTPPPSLKTRKQTKNILLSAILYSKTAAWLSFSKKLCHATKAFNKYHTNKTIFKLGKNRFISFGYQALL